VDYRREGGPVSEHEGYFERFHPRVVDRQPVLSGLSSEPRKRDSANARSASSAQETADTARSEEITGDRLADAAVTTRALANLAVDVTKLADLSVEAAKLAGSSVTATKIANAAVGAAAIANLAVGTAHIADAAITDAKIDSLSANKITAGTISGITIEGTWFYTPYQSNYRISIGESLLENRITWQGTTGYTNVVLSASTSGLLDLSGKLRISNGLDVNGGPIKSEGATVAIKGSYGTDSDPGGLTSVQLDTNGNSLAAADLTSQSHRHNVASHSHSVTI
jgi:hypothetical protein